MYVCLCKGITESDVRECGRSGCVSAEALAARLTLDDRDCCGRCLSNIEELIILATAEFKTIAGEAGYPIKT